MLTGVNIEFNSTRFELFGVSAIFVVIAGAKLFGPRHKSQNSFKEYIIFYSIILPILQRPNTLCFI